MKKTYKYFSLLLASSLLVACESETLEEIPPYPTVDLTNSVVFNNNTSVTIGSAANEDLLSTAAARSARTIALYASALSDNPACDVTMPAEPAVTGDEIYADEMSDFGWNTGRTQTAIIRNSGSYGFPMSADVYVTGTGVTISNNWNVWPVADASIVVKSGAEVSYTVGTYDWDVYNYGTLTTATTLTINSGNEFMTAGSLTLDQLNANGTVYVGGDLTVNTLTMNANGTLHVMGDLIINGTTQPNIGGNICVEGDVISNKAFDFNNTSYIHIAGDLTMNDSFHSTNSSELKVDGSIYGTELLLDCGIKVLCGCSVYASEKFTMHNSSELTALYVLSPVSEMTAGTLEIIEGGVADLGDLTIGDVNDTHIIPGSGNALLQTTSIYLAEQYSLADVLSEALYVNFDEFTVIDAGEQTITAEQFAGSRYYVLNASHTIDLGTSLVNVAVAGEKEEGECSPGYTTSTDTEDDNDDTATTDPVEDPDDTEDLGERGDTITLYIPTEIYNREWFISADDFAVRCDGIYQSNIVPENNVVTLEDVTISESNLTVRVTGLQALDFTTATEYTYELWMWVDPTSWESFTDEERAMWVAGDGEGTDISDLCTVLPEQSGYYVRYDVYTGTNGNNGDTHYIKVSIHITLTDPSEL